MVALNRNEWRSKIWTTTQDVNTKKEAQDEDCKDEQKRCRKARQSTSDFAVLCGLTALNDADLSTIRGKSMVSL